MTVFFQGEMIRAEGIRDLLLVVSKNVFNKSGQVIACPIKDGRVVSPTTHVLEEKGKTVLCDHLRYVDIEARHASRIGEISINDIVEISNIIESLFDYY